MSGHEAGVNALALSLPSWFGRARGRARPVPSLEAIYEAHFDFVFRCALRLGVPREEAGDVAQEVFLVAHRRLADFEGRSSVRTWLFGVLRRVVKDHRRRAYRRREVPRAEVEPPSRGDLCPERCAERRQAQALLHQILMELDEKKREVFILSELEELTAPEIAGALGLNLNTVYARIRAARQAFEKGLARRRAAEPRRCA